MTLKTVSLSSNPGPTETTEVGGRRIFPKDRALDSFILSAKYTRNKNFDLYQRQVYGSIGGSGSIISIPLGKTIIFFHSWKKPKDIIKDANLSRDKGCILAKDTLERPLWKENTCLTDTEGKFWAKHFVRSSNSLFSFNPGFWGMHYYFQFYNWVHRDVKDIVMNKGTCSWQFQDSNLNLSSSTIYSHDTTSPFRTQESKEPSCLKYLHVQKVGVSVLFAKPFLFCSLCICFQIWSTTN